jgi:DNA-binding NtrC family response regulator
VEQLAARMTLERRTAPFVPEDVLGLLTLVQDSDSSDRGDETSGLEAGLPAALYQTERRMLERALRENLGASRAELAARLRISERALYKKLRIHGLTAGSDASGQEPMEEEV